MSDPMRDAYTGASALAVAKAVAEGRMTELAADERDPNWRSITQEPTQVAELVVEGRRPGFLRRQLNRAGNLLQDTFGADEEADGPGNDTNYYQLGAQYFTGQGPRHQVFGPDDQATQILRQDPNLARMRGYVSEGRAPIGVVKPWDRELGGWENAAEFAAQYAALATGGAGANIADTYLGSYDTEFVVRGVDENGDAIVDVHVFNGSDLKSLTHPPVLGYTGWWRSNVEPVLQSIQPKAGPLSPTRQDFYWTEKVPSRRGARR